MITLKTNFRDIYLKEAEINFRMDDPMDWWSMNPTSFKLQNWQGSIQLSQPELHALGFLHRIYSRKDDGASYQNGWVNAYS